MTFNRDNYVSDLGEVTTRPWGNYRTVDEAETYKVKRIEVEPGAILSLQMHHHRNEHWVIVKGTATVTLDDKEIEVHENGYIYIGLEHKHRVANKGSSKLILIEVQYGEYVGEDDIVRFEDNYGRV